MSIAQYLFDHYIMLTELVGLTALLGSGVHLSEKTKKSTRVSIMLLILESVMWSLEQWTQYHDGHVLLRAMLTAGVYCMHPIIVVSIIEMMAPLKKHTIWLYAPLMVYVPAILTSQWTHIIFYIDEYNCWHGSDGLRYAPYIFFFAYVVLFLVLFAIKYIKYGMRGLFGILYIVIASFVGVYLNLSRDSAADYATLFSSVIVLYYLFQYQHMSRIDYMTGLMNRQAFYHDSEQNRRLYTAICSVDMNELKWINDTQGHAAGDQALITVAENLQKGSGTAKRVYRVGGDEFVILYVDKDEAYVQNDITRMREDLSHTKYICAFGYSMLDRNIDFESALREADQEMYSDKSKLKQAVLAAGGKLHRRAGDRQ